MGMNFHFYNASLIYLVTVLVRLSTSAYDMEWWTKIVTCLYIILLKMLKKNISAV